MSDEIEVAERASRARPWRRFFARVLDYWLLILPVGFGTGMILGALSVTWVLWLQKPMNALMLNLALAPVVMLLEALLFAWLGTTPGKWLLGVQVRTLDGQRPDLGQYLRRQSRVYVFGIAGWLPFVNLLANAHQYGKVKRGQATGYDEGRFDVVVRPLGAMRTLAAIGAFVLLLAINGQFVKDKRDSEVPDISGGTWTNQVTGKAVLIPEGWSHRKKQNQDKQDIDMFFNPDAGLYAVFAKEALPGGFDLDDYAAAWVRAVKDTMSLYVSSEGAMVQGDDALVVLGSVANDKSQKVHATLWQRKGLVWRVVLIGTSGLPPDGPAGVQLRQRLFASVD